MTITLEKSVDVAAPLKDVHDVFTQFSNFPDFMVNVQAVEQLDDTHFRWHMEVNGQEADCDIEVTEHLPEQSLSWQTTKGTRSSTTVRFKPLDDNRTTVTYTTHYPNGVGTDTTAQVIAQQTEEALSRFAALLEDTVDNLSGNQDREARSDLLAQEDRDADEEDLGAAQADDDHKEVVEQADADVLGPAYSLQHTTLSSYGSGQDANGTVATQFLRSVEAMLSYNPLAMAMLNRSGTSPQSWFSAMFGAFEAPLQALSKLTEGMDRDVRAFISTQGASTQRLLAGHDGAAWMPKVDVNRNGDTLKVTADLPGVNQSDIHVEIRNGQLLISGERHTRSEGHAEEGANISEQALERFERTVFLPTGVDAASAEAILQDGVLEITLARPDLSRQRLGGNTSQGQGQGLSA